MLKELTGCKGRRLSEVVAILLDYLFQKKNKYAVRRELDAMGLKHLSNLTDHGYILRNCKYFVYAVACGKKVKCASYEIEREDSRVLRRYAKTLTVEGCAPWSAKKLALNEHYLLTQNLKDYIGKFVSKKLIFLVHSYGLSRHDITAELQCAALTALHKSYPFFKSALHAVNIVKAAVHNAGMDMIVRYTRKKNQRLKRNSDNTFEAVNVPVSELDHLPAPCPFAQRMRDEKVGLRMLQERMNDRGALFISLARGDYNADFSQYLGMNNTELAEENYTKYFREVSKYLGVTAKERNVFFAKIRAVL